MPGDPFSTVFDCIVLGAGIAGVTAARDLGAVGRRVLLLDGSGRIGGRMHSRRDWVRGVANAAEFPLEAGAEYIHVSWFSNRYKDFFDELQKLGFKRREYKKWDGGGHNRVFFRGWQRPLNLIDTMTNECPDIWDMRNIISDVLDYKKQTDTPAGSFVASRGFVRKGLTMARYALSAHTPGLLVPGSTDDISILGMKADYIPQQLMQVSEWKILGRAQELCGYDALPRAIYDQFMQPTKPRAVAGSSILDRRVTGVSRRPDSIMEVTVAGGVGPLRARSAICTFPVGVLDPAASGAAIFGPLLTQRKRDALAVVRSGAITKFALQFKRRIWPDDDMTVLSYPEGDGRTFFSCFPGAAQGPYVLTGLMMGRDHDMLRGMPDDQAWRHIFRVLGEVFSAGVPGGWQPEAVLVGQGSGAGFTPNFLRADWGADPLFRGGNSYIAYSGNSPVRPDQARAILRDASETKPLYWAGEATAPAYRAWYQPLSVHGAYISGVGAAGDVDQYLRHEAPALATQPGGLVVARVAKTTTRKKAAKKKKKTSRRRAITAPIPEAPPKPRAVSFTLEGDDAETLRRYAKLYHRNKADAAAADLLKLILRTHVRHRVMDTPG